MIMRFVAMVMGRPVCQKADRVGVEVARMSNVQGGRYFGLQGESGPLFVGVSLPLTRRQNMAGVMERRRLMVGLLLVDSAMVKGLDCVGYQKELK